MWSTVVEKEHFSGEGYGIVESWITCEDAVHRENEVTAVIDGYLQNYLTV